MAGLEPARAYYGPTDFKSDDIPRATSPVGSAEGLRVCVVQDWKREHGVYSVHLKSNLITHGDREARPERTFENARSLLVNS
jgi:hypothetical protein